MKVLQIHCRYTRPGGEDAVVESEATLLRSRGHEVRQLLASNAGALAKGFVRAGRAVLESTWNRGAYERVRSTVREFRPDVIHVHNFWWVLSPSVFAAARAEGVPAVMTLHNYRLACPGALLMRKGRVCEECVGASAWRAVPHACYKNSMVHTAAVARMIDSNRRRGTWTRDVDAYIALTEFSRHTFSRAGLPARRIHLKPNFLARDPGAAPRAGEGAVFVGRLSREKGAHVLIDAWKRLPPAPLAIVGDGPEEGSLAARASGMRHIGFAGRLDHVSVIERIKNARFVAMPSLWYECFPLVLLEAFACGRPVVASRLGAMAELVADGRTGLLFEPGDAGDLAEKVKFLLNNPGECERMGREARAEFGDKYTAERNYPRLVEIYGCAAGNADAFDRPRVDRTHAARPALLPHG